jgi:hypothetical protein
MYKNVDLSFLRQRTMLRFSSKHRDLKCRASLSADAVHR